VEGIREVVVTRSCPNCPASNAPIQKFLFDEQGLHTARNSFRDGKLDGKQTYIYEEGQLVYMESRLTYVSTSATGDFGMEWGSTRITREHGYTFEGNRLIRAYIMEEDGTLSLEADYTYDEQGRLLNETFTDHPDPTAVGRFKSNSTELIDDPNLWKKTVYEKRYRYVEQAVTITYFKNGKQTGTEQRKLDAEGNLVSLTLRNERAKILKQESYTYQAGKLIEKQTIATDYYDGFGNPYDALAYDKEVYRYNEQGNLIEKELYIKGELAETLMYTYLP